MKIKNLQISSLATLDLELDITTPICILRGLYSDLALDLIRELIGDYNAIYDPDQFDDGHFVIHSDVEIDGKNYAACYIRNADFMGDNRLAVNFVPNSIEFSKDDTLEFIEKRKNRNVDSSNVFDRSKYNFNVENLPECDKLFTKFKRFVDELKQATANGDDRPIFIYDLIERLDASTDMTPILNELSALHRQVFISFCNSESAWKVEHEHIQMFSVKKL